MPCRGQVLCLVESLAEVSDDVIDALDTDGQTDRVQIRTGAFALLLAELAVHHARGVCDERTRVAQVRDQRQHFHAVHHLLRRVETALHAERHERPGALRRVLLRQRVELVRLQPRVRHARHLRVLLEVLCHLLRVRHVTLHPQRQGLHAHGDQECVERRLACADVTKTKGTSPDDEGETRLALRAEHTRDRPVLSERVVDVEPMVRLAVLRQDWEFTAGLPVEVTLLNDEPAHRVTVTAKELRCRVHDHVGSVLKRAEEVRGSRGVVDDQGQPVLVGDRRHLLQINNRATGVADRLAVESLRLVVHELLHLFVVVNVNEARLPTELLELTAELGDRATVQLVERHEVVPRGQDVRERQQLRRVPAGHRQRRHAALKSGDLVLEGVAGGVADAGVDGAKGGKVELGGGVLSVLEDEPRVLHDRLDTGPGHGVRLLPAKDAQRLEPRVGRGAALELTLSGHCACGLRLCGLKIMFKKVQK
eukprot:Hpha_TRINITY_DN16825_c2_g6::TRINITY_DN16825_c2_g6_i1::g.148927::m.148927